MLDAALRWYRTPGAEADHALRVAVEGYLATVKAQQEEAAADAQAAAGSAAQDAPAAALTRPVLAGPYAIYSDGSALNNPGPAGCGWVVLSADTVVFEGFEAIGVSTNQVAEIRAAAHGLNDLPAGSTVDVYTDSLYVVQTMKGAFRRKANLEHWSFIDEAVARHAAVRFHHVRGHSGHDLNERADKLANQGALRSRNRAG